MARPRRARLFSWRYSGQPALGRVGRTARSLRSLISEFGGDAANILDPRGGADGDGRVLEQVPDLDGISYEYADGFLGALTAYQNAKKPTNLVCHDRTDETGLFCEWKQLNNPNFKIYYGNGRNFQSRVALTAAMIKLKGANPGDHERAARVRKTTNADCDATSRPRPRHRPSYRRS